MAVGDRATQQAWLSRVLGVTLENDSAPPAADQLQGWTAARDTAVASLNKLLAGISKSEHPMRDRATIIVRAVRANMTKLPDTPQKLAELENYIRHDDVVAAVETPNVFNVEVAIRKPLLEALGKMKPPASR